MYKRQDISHPTFCFDALLILVSSRTCAEVLGWGSIVSHEHFLFPKFLSFLKNLYSLVMTVTKIIHKTTIYNNIITQKLIKSIISHQKTNSKTKQSHWLSNQSKLTTSLTISEIMCRETVLSELKEKQNSPAQKIEKSKKFIVMVSMVTANDNDIKNKHFSSRKNLLKKRA